MKAQENNTQKTENTNQNIIKAKKEMIKYALMKKSYKQVVNRGMLFCPADIAQEFTANLFGMNLPKERLDIITYM